MAPTRRERGRGNDRRSPRPYRVPRWPPPCSPFSARRRQASDRPIYVSVGATARAPIGWLEFCNETPKECAGTSAQPRDVVLTPKVWKDMVRVNKWVNDTIKPVTDLEHWGVVERWSYPDDGKGDCEDYVLLKRRMLIAGRLAARGAARHRGARQEGRRPRRAHGQDRQGRLHSRQPGGGCPALVRNRLPLRQAPVTEQSQYLGCARRSAAGVVHRRCVDTLTDRSYATPVTSPPLPVPRPGSRAAGVPQRRPHLFRRLHESPRICKKFAGKMRISDRRRGWGLEAQNRRETDMQQRLDAMKISPAAYKAMAGYRPMSIRAASNARCSNS